MSTGRKITKKVDKQMSKLCLTDTDGNIILEVLQYFNTIKLILYEYHIKYSAYKIAKKKRLLSGA